ncbi:hypothetical protein U6A24_18350 [Aquimarina gracilis]|uniref:Uncharacterized protein n=1 Tax=Aquimarina gracilis TaxID=874422 RepID=A0ABU5ZZY8_9FLAO|nr:hypothetical protein [Aquimarina gracilis]MEB3347443.1 hypothetical protein [Aquimarina gracilis]
MKCKIHMGNKRETKAVIVRRKFVPIQFKITRENQYVNAEAKLPFTSNAVIGMLTTNKVNACSDVPVPNRLYYGITDAQVTDTRFLKIKEGQEYTSVYPPDARIQSIGINTTWWWYYAHPVTDQFPYLFEADFVEQLNDPLKVDVQYPGQCDPIPYYLWSERLNGFAWITYTPET